MPIEAAALPRLAIASLHFLIDEVFVVLLAYLSFLEFELILDNMFL